MSLMSCEDEIPISDNAKDAKDFLNEVLDIMEDRNMKLSVTTYYLPG